MNPLLAWVLSLVALAAVLSGAFLVGWYIFRQCVPHAAPPPPAPSTFPETAIAAQGSPTPIYGYGYEDTAPCTSSALGLGTFGQIAAGVVLADVILGGMRSHGDHEIGLRGDMAIDLSTGE